MIRLDDLQLTTGGISSLGFPAPSPALETFGFKFSSGGAHIILPEGVNASAIVPQQAAQRGTFASVGGWGLPEREFKPLDDILGLLESERIIPIIDDSGVLGHLR